MKTRIRSMILASALGGASVFAMFPTPAQALFGSVCVPRLQNCMCTFIKPCPVIDGPWRAESQRMLGAFNVQQNLAEDWSKSLSEMQKSVACNQIGSIPGISAVGIDINSILRAQLPNLQLDELQIPGLDSLREDLEQLSLSTDMLQDVLSGAMTPDQFLNLAEQAGVDLSQLQEIGVTISSLQGLASGSIDGLMSMGLDRIGVDLNALGMGQEVLNQLSSGNMTVEGFLGAAQAAGVSIPQLDSMGLSMDALHGLASGDLSSLGVPNLDAIMNSVARVNIDTATLQGMLTGDVNPQRLLQLADSAGLSTSTLSWMGVDSGTLDSLASGSMNPQQLLEMAQTLNFESVALNSLGINEQLIGNIASGNLSPDAILNIANGAGLTLPDLQGLGLDPSSLTSMISQGPAGLMSTLQNAGMGNPILSSLNIDAGMLGQIASGQLPASAINDLMAGTGINPNAIVIPGLDGAISAMDGIEGAINGPIGAINEQLGQLNSQLSEMINIPIPSIPGLGSILGSCGSGVSPDLSINGLGGANDPANAAAGTGAPPPAGVGAGTPPPGGGGGAGTGAGGGAGSAGSLAGTGTGSGAVCTPNRPLITSTQPPSEFTAEIQALEFALAGSGDIFEQQEAIADAMGEAQRVYGASLARSIVLRPLIPEALDSIRAIEDQMALIDANGTTEEALKMNSAIKVHLLSAQAEVTSLMTYTATMEAARQLNRFNFSALPIFPHNSEWEAEFQETIRPAVDELIDTTAQAEEASRNYNDFNYQARQLRNAHEMAVHKGMIDEQNAALVEQINIAEAQKENLYHMETQIRGALAGLYENPDAAWEIMKGDMEANAGNYMDIPAKWDRSENQANALSDMATAQAATTRYGQRILVAPGNSENPPQYSSIGEMPYSYAYVNSRLLPEDPMQIQRPFMMGGGGGDGDSPPPPPLMSGGIQTYMETYRRERDWTAQRRGGNGARTTSGAAWNELLDFAPECLAGPIPTSAENLLRRPDLFDVAPSCTHLTWTDGDDEDYIAASNFGGFDSILWRNKIEANKAVLQSGAMDDAGMQPALAARANDLIAMESTLAIESELRAVEYTAAADHTAALREMLTIIANDTALETAVVTPRLMP